MYHNLLYLYNIEKLRTGKYQHQLENPVSTQILLKKLFESPKVTRVQSPIVLSER